MLLLLLLLQAGLPGVLVMHQHGCGFLAWCVGVAGLPSYCSSAVVWRADVGACCFVGGYDDGDGCEDAGADDHCVVGVGVCAVAFVGAAAVYGLLIAGLIVPHLPKGRYAHVPCVTLETPGQQTCYCLAPNHPVQVPLFCVQCQHHLQHVPHQVAPRAAC